MKYFFSRLLAITLVIGTSACSSDEDIVSETIPIKENKLDWNTTQLIGPYNTIPPDSDLTTIKIWETTVEGKQAYNHFPMIHLYNNRLYVMWMTHNYDEHGSGQTLSWTYSDDFGTTWTPVSYLFEPLADINAREYSTSESYYMTPIGFCELSDGLYVVGEVMDSMYYHLGPIGALARKINADGTLGDAFWVYTYDGLETAPIPTPGYSSYPYNASKWQEIITWFTSLGNRPPSHGSASTDLQSRLRVLDEQNYTYQINGHFTEQSETYLNNGSSVRIWRGFFSPYKNEDYLFAQYSSDGINYPNLPVKTNIPSPRARATIKNIDGKIVLIGSPQDHPITGVGRSSLYLAIADDDLKFNSDNIYTFRDDVSEKRFPGTGKNGKVSYPDFLQLPNGKIACVYSTREKEDIEFSTFILPELQ